MGGEGAPRPGGRRGGGGGRRSAARGAGSSRGRRVRHRVLRAEAARERARRASARGRGGARGGVPRPDLAGRARRHGQPAPAARALGLRGADDHERRLPRRTRAGGGAARGARAAPPRAHRAGPCAGAHGPVARLQLRRRDGGGGRMSSRAAVLSRPQVDLAELLDRTLGTGVVAAGDLTLSVAGVELVYLNLRALLASVATLEEQGIPFPAHGGSGVEHGPGRLVPRAERAQAPGAGAPAATEPARRRRAGLPAGARPDTWEARRRGKNDGGEKREDERLERGLAQRVRTVTELLRELMGREARGG